MPAAMSPMPRAGGHRGLAAPPRIQRPSGESCGCFPTSTHARPQGSARTWSLSASWIRNKTSNAGLRRRANRQLRILRRGFDPHTERL